MAHNKIDWDYFFGGSHEGGFDRYYQANIDGVRVEKHATRNSVRFSIGNMDKAKVKFKTEQELINAINQSHD